MGTPKTLSSALANALADAREVAKTAGECAEAVLVIDGPHLMVPAVKDFLAQKFSTAILKAKTDEEADRLEDLFKKITQKDAA